MNRPPMIPMHQRKVFWRLTLKDILIILCAVAVPIALVIYTSSNNRQAQQQAEEVRLFDLQQALETRQQLLYDTFLNNIYKLDNDGHLNDDRNPWAFANAFYRAGHRQWDPIRKADVLQFLKEQKLIGRNNHSTECQSKGLSDIIRLNLLNFDHVNLFSQTGTLNRLDLEWVVFDQVSMSNATFSYVNLNNVAFQGGRLDNSKFNGSSLVCAHFDGIILDGVDFSNSDLTKAEFFNLDLSNVKLTAEQIQQAKFYNVTMPDGTVSQTKTTSKIQIPTTSSAKTTTTKKSTNITPVTTKTTASTTVVTSAVSTSTTTTTTTSTATSSTTTTTTTTTAVTSTSTTATTSLYWIAGPIVNLDPADLQSNGWFECYNSTYNVGLDRIVVTSILSRCNKERLLLACKSTTARFYSVAAMGFRSDVLHDCGTQPSCVKVANGVGWYFSVNYSWGFVNGGDAVTRSSCDTGSTNAGYRLCWHTESSSGYRCGKDTKLNLRKDWQRSIWHAD